MTYKAIIFDWDGTLVDSEAHIVDCITQSAHQMGLPDLDYSKKKGIIGLGMREALLALYPSLLESQIEQMRSYYSAHFFSRSTAPVDLFPLVLETLNTIKSRGFAMAVATGKSRNGLQKALLSSGLGSFFDIERCADETRSKPHPMMLEEIAAFYRLDYEDMLMVGDTTYDLEMAKNVGMPSVAVSYGVHEVDALEAHKPKAIIDQFSDLLHLI